MKTTCLVVRNRLPGRDAAGLEGRLGRHVNTCLTCQAEQARYRSLHRRLGALRESVVEAPPGLIGAVLVAVDEAEQSADVSRHNRSHGPVVAAAAGAAVVAAAAGTIVVLGLRRVRAA